MRVQKYHLAIRIAGVLCVLGATVPGAHAQPMQYPISAVQANDGTIYVADTDAPGIWQVKDGKVAPFFQASKKFRTPLNRPRCLALDGQGRLLAGDSSTREVYRFDSAGKPQPLTEGSVGIPRAIVVLPSGELLVADQELHCIWKIPASGGKPQRWVVVPGLVCMAVDPDGVLWVTGGPKQHLRKITPDGKIEDVVTKGPFQFPQEIVVDDAKNILIADNYAKTIWKVVPGQQPEKLVEGAPLVSPTGICRGAGGLLVTDPHAQAIFHVDAGGKVTKLAP